jgi:hypothetical protein
VTARLKPVNLSAELAQTVRADGIHNRENLLVFHTERRCQLPELDLLPIRLEGSPVPVGTGEEGVSVRVISNDDQPLRIQPVEAELVVPYFQYRQRCHHRKQGEGEEGQGEHIEQMRQRDAHEIGHTLRAWLCAIRRQAPFHPSRPIQYPALTHRHRKCVNVYCAA